MYVLYHIMLKFSSTEGKNVQEYFFKAAYHLRSYYFAFVRSADLDNNVYCKQLFVESELREREVDCHRRQGDDRGGHQDQ